MRDAAHQSAPQRPEAAASQNDEPRVQLLGYPYNLRIRLTEPHVRLSYLAAGLPYPLHLLVEHHPGLYLGALLHPALQIRECPGARRLIEDGRYMTHMDDMQLRACSLGQVGGR